jgi:hypothetical protein
VHGPDQALGAAIVAYGLSDGPNPAAQSGLGYDPAVPYPLVDVAFGDHAFAIGDQQRQKRKHLRFHCDGRTILTQLKAIHVELKRGEAVNHGDDFFPKTAGADRSRVLQRIRRKSPLQLQAFPHGIPEYVRRGSTRSTQYKEILK